MLKVFEHGDVEVVQCSVQGWRKTMEDVALVQCGVSPREVGKKRKRGGEGSGG